MKKKIVIAMPNAGNNLFRMYMKSKYVTSVMRSGAKMKIIDITDHDKAIAEALKCDGLLLPGGPDITPTLYGQIPMEKCGAPNELRDKVEPDMFHAFFQTQKPILAICRGMQLLNVCCNGTLMQDISTIQKCKHIDFPGRKKSCHSVQLTADTKLADLLGNKLSVNSLHHQVVDKLGEGLSINAISEDGFIEGIEYQDHPWCIGVQWHPEHMSKYDSLQQKLFDEFIKQCQSNKAD